MANSTQLDLLDRRRSKRNRKSAPALEGQEQEALFRWAKVMERKYPELYLLHASANGGWRYKATAVALKRQGVKAGIPDVCLPVARGGYGALYIELKRRERGVVSEVQSDMIAALRETGNRVEVCYGWDDARSVIEDYLDGVA